MHVQHIHIQCIICFIVINASSVATTTTVQYGHEYSQPHRMFVDASADSGILGEDLENLEKINYNALRREGRGEGKTLVMEVR